MRLEDEERARAAGIREVVLKPDTADELGTILDRMLWLTAENEIERIAIEHGLTHLEMVSSITAVPFYSALGYEIIEHGEHMLRTGRRMACVKMRKNLAPQ